MENKELTDSVGNPILEGDLVRIFHFVGARGKRHFMYKRVVGVGKTPSGKDCITYRHLENGEFNDVGNRYKNIIVVVGRAKFHNDNKYDELKRNKKLSD